MLNQLIQPNIPPLDTLIAAHDNRLIGTQFAQYNDAWTQTNMQRFYDRAVGQNFVNPYNEAGIDDPEQLIDEAYENERNELLYGDDPNSIDLNLPIFVPVPVATVALGESNPDQEVIAKVDKELEIADYVPKGKFRLQNQKLMLTYKTKLDKAEYKEWLGNMYEGVKQIEMAHETGLSKNVPYEHTHVLIDFGRNVQVYNPRKFDFKNIHPNIKKVTTTTHWVRCLNYLAKEDPDNAHLKTETSIVDVTWGSANLEEAIRRGVKKANDVSGIVQLYNMKPEETPYKCEKPTFGWTLTVIPIAESEVVDHRHIIWFYDPIGDRGKTWIIKYLLTNSTEKGRYAWCTQVGGMYHFSNTVINWIKAGWNKKVFLFNLAKDNQDKQIYEPLEALKDGLITSVKFAGGNCCFENPTVIVMANFPPKMSRMGKNRFIVYGISNDGQSCEQIYNEESGLDSWHLMNLTNTHEFTDGNKTLLTIVNNGPSAL